MESSRLGFALASVLAVLLSLPASAAEMGATKSDSNMMKSDSVKAGSMKSGSMKSDTAKSDQADVTATVQKWVADFSKGDGKAFLAACAPGAVIVDNFAPYVWQGPTACSDWWNANDAYNKSIQATGGVLTLGKSLHFASMGDRAYAVYAVKFADTEKGKAVVQTATWALTLQKLASGWAFTSSSWHNTK